MTFSLELKRLRVQYSRRLFVRPSTNEYYKYKLERYEGINLCDLTATGRRRLDFLNRTKQALDMIRDDDPRRFRRVQRCLRYIVNVELTSLGQYRNYHCACSVDMAKYRFDINPEFAVMRLASTIVHEATHGAIYRRGVSYTRAYRGRIEALCHLEQERFYRKVAPDLASRLIGPFNEERWHKHWNWRSEHKLNKAVRKRRLRLIQKYGRQRAGD